MIGLKSFVSYNHDFILLHQFTDKNYLNVNVFHIEEKRTKNKDVYCTAIREDGVMLFGMPEDRITDEIFINKRLKNSKIKAYNEFISEEYNILMKNYNLGKKDFE